MDFLFTRGSYIYIIFVRIFNEYTTKFGGATLGQKLDNFETVRNKPSNYHL